MLSVVHTEYNYIVCHYAEYVILHCYPQWHFVECHSDKCLAVAAQGKSY
jgi:hypothetical protein